MAYCCQFLYVWSYMLNPHVIFMVLYISWFCDLINDLTQISPKQPHSYMTIHNTWMWSFLRCQSMYNHHLINYQVVWNNTFKEIISIKLFCLFVRKWTHYTWPWPGYSAICNAKLYVPYNTRVLKLVVQYV